MGASLAGCIAFLQPPMTHKGTSLSWPQAHWSQVCHINHCDTAAHYIRHVLKSHSNVYSYQVSLMYLQTFPNIQQLPRQISPFYWPFSRWTWVSQYQNVSVLNFTGAKDDGGGGDNCSYKMCKAADKSSPPTNQHPTFYRPMPFLSTNQEFQSKRPNSYWIKTSTTITNSRRYKINALHKMQYC